MKNNSGITLIELVVTMILIAALSAVAVPVFSSHLDRVRRNEGVNAVQAILSTAKDYYRRHGRSFAGSSLKTLEIDLTDFSARWNFEYRLVSPDAISITVWGKTGTSYDGLKVNLFYQPGQEPKVTDATGKKL